MNAHVQPDLFDFIGTPEDEQKFADFDAAHPEVWRTFELFTFELIKRGFKHHSADAVLHRLRWDTPANADGKPFKINNTYTAYYARKFHRLHPKFLGFFRNRKSKADREQAA